MIITVDQDFFKNESAAYFHCANCYCKMKAGIAAGISEHYPEAVQADLNTIPGDRNKLGKFTSAIGSNGKLIYNLYGQFYYGTGTRKINYEAFYNGLKFIHDDLTFKKINTVAVPYKIGCNLAGGSWRIVYAMLEDVWETSPIQLTICRKID
jgi:O-acetyl-ADP-ribose deacetylase (regulator of RNase III)